MLRMRHISNEDVLLLTLNLEPITLTLTLTLTLIVGRPLTETENQHHQASTVSGRPIRHEILIS